MIAIATGEKRFGKRIRNIALAILRFSCVCSAICAIVIALLWLNSVWPYNWNLPEGMPLVLGLSTDMDVEAAVKVFRENFHVKDNDFSIRTLRKGYVFFKKRTEMQEVVVENFSTHGISERTMKCTFLHGRLMSILFIPALTDDECQTILGEDYKKYILPLPELMRHSSGTESKENDQLTLVDWVWGSGIHSKLLTRAYVDWMFYTRQ